MHFSLGERNWRWDSELANQRVGCETRANEAERDRNSLVGLLRSLLVAGIPVIDHIENYSEHNSALFSSTFLSLIELNTVIAV